MAPMEIPAELTSTPCSASTGSRSISAPGRTSRFRIITSNDCPPAMGRGVVCVFLPGRQRFVEAAGRISLHSMMGLSPSVALPLVLHRVQYALGEQRRSFSLTPSAWETALPMAGAMPTMASSPMPLAPNGPSGSGTSTAMGLISGISWLDGIL